MNDFKKMYKDPDMETAQNMLMNIYAGIDTKPTKVPFDVLASYVTYRKERFWLQKGVLIGLFILFIMVPLWFIPPRFTVDAVKEGNNVNTSYRIVVENRMPVISITATMNGRTYAVMEEGTHVYNVKPVENGDLTVKVTLWNSQYNATTVTVNDIDESTPQLISSVREGDLLKLTVKDDGSGVDYAGAYALLKDGSKVKPVSTDEAEGVICFGYSADTLNLYIPDKYGNVLHLVLASQPTTEPEPEAEEETGE